MALALEEGSAVVARVAVVDPTPAYRRGLSAALADAGYLVDEPSDPCRWIAGGGRRVLLVTTPSATHIEAYPRPPPGDCVRFVALLTEPTLQLYAAILAWGASAVRWDATPEEIVEVVHAAAGQWVLLPAAVARSLAVGGGAVRPPSWVGPEQVEWLRALAGCDTVATIARRHGWSERAMYRRLRRLYGLMGVSNRTQALVLADRWRLLS